MHYGCDGTYKYTLQPDWSREEGELQVHYFAGTQPSHAFPFFIVKNASRYSNSSLSKLFNCDKDMFYRFMNDGNVKWRKLLYNRFKKLKKSVLLLKDLLFPREIFIFALKWNCYEQI